MVDIGANVARGEATIIVNGEPITLRPTFSSLVMCEEELGSLYDLVERAGEGKLKISEVSALFWHCLHDRSEITRDQVGQAIVDSGLASISKPLRILLHQILQGHA